MTDQIQMTLSAISESFRCLDKYAYLDQDQEPKVKRKVARTPRAAKTAKVECRPGIEIERKIARVAPAPKGVSGFGTNQWAPKAGNVNFQSGCENNCRYCYAEALDTKFRCDDQERDWSNPVIRQHDIKKMRQHRDVKRRLFPSSHDIVPANLENYKHILAKLVNAKQEIVIVSKPRIDCVKSICDEFGYAKDLLTFRFTIGSVDDNQIKIYEPSAPSFEERLECLKYAFLQGYNTSVSCEPMLDLQVERVVETARPYVTHSIWLGLIDPCKPCGNDPIFKEIESLEHCNYLYSLYSSDPLIQWKDRIAKKLGLPCMIEYNPATGKSL